jgi:hypothetical protein
VTIDNKKEPDSDKVVCDGKRAITISAIERRCAEISGMLASGSNLTAEEQEQLKAEFRRLKSFNRSSFVRARKKAPAWSSAADLLFDKGLQEAREKARQECERVLKRHQMAKSAGTPGDAVALLDTLKSLRDRSFFEFLARYCETFPECKKELGYDVARAYCDDSLVKSEMFSALQKQALCKPETLRFLRAYLEGDDPLRKLPLSECARRMGWFTKEAKPNHARVREILREYGIKHGMKGKRGRPKKTRS